jgi:hypothetical protein
MKGGRFSDRAAATIVRACLVGLTCALPGAGLLGCNLVAGLDQFDNAVAEDTASDAASSGDDSAQVPGSPSNGLDSGVPGNPGADQGPPSGDDSGSAPPPMWPSDSGFSETPDAGTTSPPGDMAVQDSGYVSSHEDAPSMMLDPGADAANPVDAASPLDAGPAGPWCATHMSPTTLDCHDFDEGQPPQTGFSNNYFSGRFATVTTTDFAPGSPPGSLLLSTPLLDAGAPAQDEQFNDLVAFHPKVELSFALKIVDYDPGAGDVSLFRISYQTGTWAMQFDLQQHGASFTETSTADGGTKHTTYSAAQPTTLDAWTNVDCLIDFNAHTLSLSYDGKAVLSNQPIENPNDKNPQIFVQAGLNYLVAPAKPMMIYDDNILLAAPP